MCGIGGILRVWKGEAPPARDAIPEAWLDALDAGIRHRGPDGQGRFRDRGWRDGGIAADVAFVHRRLSILDHAGGVQPMLTRGEVSGVDSAAHLFQGDPDAAVAYRAVDGRASRFCTVFNGCIYNHRDVRAKLTASGARFVTDHSDTECVLHAYTRWGEQLPAAFDSMHAMAIWDSHNARLLLSRDLFGEKPLYVLSLAEKGIWAFASTAGALVRLMRVMDEPIDWDERVLMRWIGFGYDDRATPFAAITQVPPGETGPIESMGARHVMRRWSGEGRPTRRGQAVTRDGLIEHWEANLLESVAPRLEADVPVACLLSGGVDSSLVAWAASRLRKDLRCITVRMPDAAYDESAYAAEIAQALGVRHTIVDTDSDVAQGLDRLIGEMGLPFGDSSLLPSMWASRAAHELGTVLLSGDGGDELFLGYERYSAARLLSMLSILTPSGFGADRFAAGSDPKSWRSKLARLMSAAANHGYLDLLAIFPSPILRAIAGNDEALSRANPIRNALEARAYDLTHHLPGDMLRKVDAASMSVGVEMRAPFLSHAFACEAIALPQHQACFGGKRKGLLRAIASRHLPRGPIARRKMGFAIPIGRWLREDYAGLRTRLNEAFHDAAFLPPGLDLELNARVIGSLIDEHMHGVCDHSQRLYMLLVLNAWTRWFASIS